MGTNDTSDKVHCEAEIKGTEIKKHFDIPQESTFEHLLGTVVKAFLLEEGTEAKLKYIDEDGEEVTFDTTEELREAILMAQASGNRCLHLDVSGLNLFVKQRRECRRHREGRLRGAEKGEDDEEARKQRALMREERRKQRKLAREGGQGSRAGERKKRKERKGRKAERMLEELDETTRKDWEEMLQKLNELGFDKPAQNMKLIRRFCLPSASAEEGQKEAGIDQVVRLLSERKQRKLERQEKKMKRLRDEDALGEDGEKISLRKSCKKEDRKAKKERKKRRCAKHASSTSAEDMTVVKNEEASDSGSTSECTSSASSDENAKPWKKHIGKRSGLREEGYFDLPFAQSSQEVLKVWPEQVTHLFLDGNNMLFITDGLRRFTLQRAGRHIAEDALTAVAEAFALAMAKTPRPLKQTIMIYDHIGAARCYTKQLAEDAGAFITCSARPAFSTSDDQLVEWAKANRDLAAKSLYVTSDRELKDRLVAAGAMVVKPKSWFTAAVKVISEAQGWPQDLSLDAFVAKYIRQ